MKQTKTNLQSGLHALLWKEGKWYVAKCVEVEITSQGKTKKEAMSNVIEALELYFEEEKIPKIPTYENVELHNIASIYA